VTGVSTWAGPPAAPAALEIGTTLPAAPAPGAEAASRGCWMPPDIPGPPAAGGGAEGGVGVTGAGWAGDGCAPGVTGGGIGDSGGWYRTSDAGGATGNEVVAGVCPRTSAPNTIASTSAASRLGMFKYMTAASCEC